MEELTAQPSNIESTVLPLLSICSLTGEYQEKKVGRKRLKYRKLVDIEELPAAKSVQLVQLIQVCQDTFEKEADVLIDNQMAEEAVDELFLNYKQYLIGLFSLSTQYYEPSKQEYNNYEDTWFSGVDLNLDNTSSSFDTTDSFTFDLNDFDFDYANLTTSTNSEISQSFDFSQSQLCNGPDFLFSDYIQFHDETKENDVKADDYYYSGSRRRITKESRNMLEALFIVKNSPNSAERKLIAERCHLSPAQVRIWFTNKRSRCKGKGC